MSNKQKLKELEAAQVVIFEKELHKRASMMGWDEGVQDIHKSTNNDGIKINLIANMAKSMPTHSKQVVSPSFSLQASMQTSELDKTMNKCGAVCTAASPRKPKPCCFPIKRIMKSSSIVNPRLWPLSCTNNNEAGNT